MRKITTVSILLLAIWTATSCSDKKAKEVKQDMSKDSLIVGDTSLLADKNFIYKNVKNTQSIKFVERRPAGDGVDDNLYTDSTFKKAFQSLTPYQKIKIIGPFIADELGVNEKYPRDLMVAHFISKQDKIGEFQPIIVFISGDDYSSDTMILLDKNNKPVSGFNLDGGKETGPTEIGDSLLMADKTSYSLINKDKITTIRVRQTDYTDSTKRASILDTSVFVTTIDKKGKFNTRQTVKTQHLK